MTDDRLPCRDPRSVTSAVIGLIALNYLSFLPINDRYDRKNLYLVSGEKYEQKE